MNSPTFFGTESFLEGSPVLSKAASGYIGQIFQYWMKGNIHRFEKSRPNRNKKTSRELPASAGEFSPVTCGNRGQSLPTEIFACIRR